MQATDTPSIIHRYFMIKNSSFQTCNTLNIKALELYYNIKKWNIELDTLFINIVSPNNDMLEHLQALLAEYPMIDIRAMGFPLNNWENEPLWSTR